MREAKEVTRMELAEKMGLLTVLYMIQGIPVGLAMGSVPYLLKNTMGYSDVAMFSLSAWPYSLKLLWSPVVDGVYWRALGRRKSWIVPLQVLMGATMIYISNWIDCYLPNEECRTYGPRLEAPGVGFITFWFVVLVFLSATQDIALDGWALEHLPEGHRELSSTCQTLGISGGFFMSFTVLLALSSRAFVEKWLPFLDSPPLTISGYISSAGYVAAAMAVVVLLTPEESPVERLDVSDVYRRLIDAIGSRRGLLALLTVHKIGFVANDAAVGLLLLERGFQREDFAIAALFDFPVQMALGVIVGRWARHADPTGPWLTGQLLRLVACLTMNVYVFLMLERGVGSNWSILVVSILTMLGSAASTITFVSQGALFANLSDASIGGTYQTLLNTASNFGGTWPKFFILRAIDMFNADVCDSEDSCVRVREGYFPVAFGCIALGMILYQTLVKRWARRTAAVSDTGGIKLKAS